MTAAPARLPVIVVMGVSGSGKSTVGALLAKRLGVPYAEADDFHPAVNIAKMTAGQPLDDTDREPWLDAIADWIAEHGGHGGRGEQGERGGPGGPGQRGGRGGVVGCSALRHRYRDRLRAASPDLFFLHLDGPPALIRSRLAARMQHFMPSELLGSQFEALEPLQPGEAGAVVPIDGGPQQTADRALALLPGWPGSLGRPAGPPYSP